jgi:hypothetical protein
MELFPWMRNEEGIGVGRLMIKKWGIGGCGVSI